MGRRAPSLGNFLSYLAGDVGNGESLQSRGGRGGDSSGTVLGVVQESGDGLGEHRIPQGQQVNDHLGLLLGTSEPPEDGFHPTLHHLLGICRRRGRWGTGDILGTPGAGSQKAKCERLQRTHLQPTELLLAQFAHQRAYGNYPCLPGLRCQLLPIQLVLGIKKGVIGSRKKEMRGKKEKEYALPLISKCFLSK